MSRKAFPSQHDGFIDLKHEAHADDVRHLPPARERVQVIHSWLVGLIMEHQWEEQQVKGTNHIFDCVSSAMLAYQNCRFALKAKVSCAIFSHASMKGLVRKWLHCVAPPVSASDIGHQYVHCIANSVVSSVLCYV